MKRISLSIIIILLFVSGCSKNVLILDDGRVFENVSTETLEMYTQKEIIDNAIEEKYKAITKQGLSEGQLVMLAYENQRNPLNNFQKSKTWDERLLPYLDRALWLFGGTGNVGGDSKESDMGLFINDSSNISISGFNQNHDKGIQNLVADFNITNKKDYQYINQKYSPNANNGYPYIMNETPYNEGD